jgi:hypothetical protein
MGYRDDFYKAENMIGYSGDLHSFPTVYFQSGREFGHITQEHGNSQNVGRGTVRSDATYSIGNETVDGSLRLVEKRSGKIFHKSRSTLTRVEQMPFDDKSVILQAIWKYPDEKYISGYNSDIRTTIKGAKQAKSAAHQEMFGA